MSLIKLINAKKMHLVMEQSAAYILSSRLLISQEKVVRRKLKKEAKCKKNLIRKNMEKKLKRKTKRIWDPINSNTP